MISSQKAAAAAAAAAAANSVSLSSNSTQTLQIQTPSSNNAANSPIDSTQTTSNQSQKVYYLICGFCRWSSRDVGIPDANTSIFFVVVNPSCY